MESNLNPKEQRIAILHIPGEEPIELPILSGTEGKDVIDIKNLSAKGYFTYDPGLLATASCQSKITFINGEKGILLHRGYPIAELAMQTSYLELCYLLLYKELPNQAQLSEFKNKISHNTMVHEQIPKLFQAFRRDAHPMAIMCGIAGALSAFYHEQINVSNPKDRELVAIRLLAKIPTLAAMAYKYSEGQPFMYPQNNLSYAGNFLHMMFATPCEPYVVNSGKGNGQDLHSARRSRAERFNLLSPFCRFNRCQPLCMYCRRYCCIVGSGSRRCQRGMSENA